MKMLKCLGAVLLAMMLVACGGGGGSAGTSPFAPGASTPTSPVPTGPAISVTLSKTSVTVLDPATVTATVTDSATGAPMSGQVVTFTTTNNVGSFVPTTGTALTDANGVAVVSLSPGAANASGAAQVIASVTVNAATVTASVGFQFSASNATAAPALALKISNTVVTLGNPATLTATVTDASSGTPLSGKVVKFTTDGGSGTFTPSSGTALTDLNGVAIVSLSPATAASNGAENVTASVTVNGSTASDSKGFQFAASNVTIASFTSGVGSGRLSAYGQTNATVTLSGAAAGSAVGVSVTSTCIAAGKATISPATVSTTTGKADFTYRDLGCGATQTADTLQASISSTAATAQLTFGIERPAVNSIGFGTATPSVIYLKGSGFGESATVTFIVKDSAGNPLPNQAVRMELLTLNVGLQIEGGTAAVTRTSDATGTVSVIVNSGTVPTPVRVKATLVGSSISTVSSNLSVAVGIPSEINFGLAQTAINIEGFNFLDTPNTYTVIASDRVANPVPVGTAINFVAEGGQIESSKQIALTAAGIARADANFVSSTPKPDDGRITIVAYALGEESFKDLNGNNVYDAGEPFQDLGDPYRDRLFDGVFEAANDEVLGTLPSLTATCVTSTAPELRASIAIPSKPGTCDGKWGTAYVRKATETVLSTSSADPVWFSLPSSGTGGRPINLYTQPAAYLSPVPAPNPLTATYLRVAGSSLTNMGGIGSFTFIVRDSNPVRLNPVAAGSVITVEATTGLSVKVLGGSPVVSTSEATGATISYEFDTATSSGTVTITITSPRGLKSGASLNISR